VNGSSLGLLRADPVAARTALACFASAFFSSGFVGGVAAPAASPLGGVPDPDDVGAVVVLGVVVVVPGAVPVVVVVGVVGVVEVVGLVVDVVEVVVVVLDVVVVVVLGVVVVVVVGARQWSSLPLALPWSSQSLPFSFGSGLQSLPLLPWEQSSPGEPGTVVWAPPPLFAGVASAVDAPIPASSSPTSARTFARLSLNAIPSPLILWMAKR
jgi:hypothetical protein